MQEILTTSNIMFVIGIIGIIIGVYKSIFTPQAKMDKNQALNEERDKNKATLLEQKEVDTKAQLLAQQMNNEKEDNNRRFAEMGVRIDKAFEIAQNHINTIETEVKALTITVGGMCNNITELKTIINERIPKK
jgi:hypothetical protein